MGYELVFRQAGGDYSMLVDDPSSPSEPPSFHGQRLKRGTVLRVRGLRWRVVEQVENGGLTQFVCERRPWYRR